MKKQYWKLLYAPSLFLFIAGFFVGTIVPETEYLFVNASIIWFLAVSVFYIIVKFKRRELSEINVFRNRYIAFNAVSLVLFAAGIVLFATVSSGLLLFLPFTAFAASALLFVIPTVFFNRDEAYEIAESRQRRYTAAYKIFIILFIVGIPTIAVSIISIAYFTAVTTFLINGLIRKTKSRITFFVLTLSMTAVIMAGSLVRYMQHREADEGLGMFFGFILMGMLFLGVAAAGIIKLIIWLDLRMYLKKVLEGRSGVSFYKAEPEDPKMDSGRRLAMLRREKEE